MVKFSQILSLLAKSTIDYQHKSQKYKEESENLLNKVEGKT